MVRGGKIFHVLEDGFLEVVILEIVDAWVVVLELLDRGGLGVHDCNEAVLEGVSVDETLLNVGREHKDIFKLLGCDVFALGELEDILSAVNDLD